MMIANPIADQTILCHYRERSISKADADRIDFLLTCQFLNCSPGWPGLLKNCR